MENYHVIQYTGSALQFYGDMNLHECHGWISFHLLHKCVSAIPKLQAGIVPGIIGGLFATPKSNLLIICTYLLPFGEMTKRVWAVFKASRGNTSVERVMCS